MVTSMVFVSSTLLLEIFKRVRKFFIITRLKMVLANGIWIKESIGTFTSRSFKQKTDISRRCPRDNSLANANAVASCKTAVSTADERGKKEGRLYTYRYIHIHRYVHINIHLHTPPHNTRISIYLYIIIYIHLHIAVYLYTHICMYVHLYMHICIHIWLYACMYTLARTHSTYVGRSRCACVRESERAHVRAHAHLSGRSGSGHARGQGSSE